MGKRVLRILIAKPGLDGHDRGARSVALALRDAGMEVIYSGLHCPPDVIISTAMQENVDAVGLSLLSGAHMTLFPKIQQLMKSRGLGDVLLFGGGVIPREDIEQLKSQGIGEIFPPGSSMQDIVSYLNKTLPMKRDKARSN